MDYAVRVAEELRLSPDAVARTLELLAQQFAVPFIARYRKEATGGLSEAQIIQVRDVWQRQKKLDHRKKSLLRGIGDAVGLSPEFQAQVEAAKDWDRLDDLFAAYRVKHSPAATQAIEQGLAPLADLLWSRQPANGDDEQIVAPYLNPEKGLVDAPQVWAGVRELLAERISLDAGVRDALRDEFAKNGMLHVAVNPGKEKKAGDKYKEYFDVTIAADRVSGPRIMAIRRGVKEGLLSYQIGIDRPVALGIIRSRLDVTDGLPFAAHWSAVCEQAFDAYLALLMETAAKRDLQRRAEKEGIETAAKALRRILMAPPLGAKWMLVVDPGPECRITAIDGNGALLASTKIEPLASDYDRDQARKVVEDYCRRYRIEAIIIGAGAEARVIETFFRQMDREQLNDADVIPFNHTTTLAVITGQVRQEFPDLEETICRAIGICRCLQDPLAELVKSEPLALIGAHSHLDQPALQQALHDTVASCVNAVGADVNFAHEALLSHVAGLNRDDAGAIIERRAKHGAFQTREQVREAAQLAPAVYEQAIGFLRIKHGENPLDASGIHPAHYPVVAKMATDLNVEIRALFDDEATRARVEPERYSADGLSAATVKDILAELTAPGHDPRQPFKPLRLNPELVSPDQLKEGMILEGVVANLSAFGAFVNIGVQDGLVHVSELAHEFVDDPAKVIQVGQQVKVKVIGIDPARKRLSLSIKQTIEPPPAPPRKHPEPRPPRPESRPPRSESRPPRSESRPPRSESRPERTAGRPRGRDERPMKPAPVERPHYDSPFAGLSLENGVIKLRDDGKKKNK